ncbi:DNA-binding domain-containing protein, AraC-type [Chamaesiphon minutus PCC 6605]|uniref:DNA-binding domain-containing protein, AraC-type n=2 Tax=Chamaesiphon TaxID=217161 RepID=K9UN75_CHAP6|nr:DNA-binding domain-containing protein, AraC-type [Chamaesiphon minutus PCC 6605]
MEIELLPAVSTALAEQRTTRSSAQISMSDLEPEHLHLASSFESGWEGVNLILEREPRGEMPAATMNFHFLTIALDNFSCSYKTANGWQSVDYQAGDVAIIPQTELFPHVYIESEVLLLELFLHPAQTKTLAPGKQLVPQIQVRDPLIVQMGLALYREWQCSGAEGRLYADSISIALSAHLAQNYSTAKLASVGGILSPRDTDRIKDYIEAYLGEELTVARLSRVVDLSVHHFATVFRRTFGITPHQYILKQRIARSQILLKTTSQPIVAIAHRVGFQTQSHFTRIFHQHTHCTPKQYRDRI